MNNPRRKQLEKAIELLNEAMSIIEEVTCEEQDAFDNMPEGLQCSERGEQMEENVANLEDSSSNIEDVISTIEDIMAA